MSDEEPESNNGLGKALRVAERTGWSINPPDLTLTYAIIVLHLALDNNFWQALAAEQHWAEWERHRQEFIDHLADGGDASVFFDEILK